MKRTMNELYANDAKASLSAPVQPVANKNVPVISIERWGVPQAGPQRLRKQFLFANSADRNAFIDRVFAHEAVIGHNVSEMTVTPESVTITLMTENIEKVTELDKEFALYADSVYKDIAYEQIKSRKRF